MTASLSDCNPSNSHCWSKYYLLLDKDLHLSKPFWAWSLPSLNNTRNCLQFPPPTVRGGGTQSHLKEPGHTKMSHCDLLLGFIWLSLCWGWERWKHPFSPFSQHKANPSIAKLCKELLVSTKGCLDATALSYNVLLPPPPYKGSSIQLIGRRGRSPRQVKPKDSWEPKGHR